MYPYAIPYFTMQTGSPTGNPVGLPLVSPYRRQPGVAVSSFGALKSVFTVSVKA